MPKASIVAALALVAGLIMSTPTNGVAAPPQFVTAVEGIAEFKLDNGLRVLLFPDPSKPKVTVNLTVFVGSRHEGYGEAGMAHLLEHMLFKGTPAHPDVPEALREHGAEYNGTTWLDRTNYFETLPASEENLEFAIRLEADRMVNSYVRGEDLESEMTVVRNEFERGENSPSRILNQRMFSAAYEWHNYGKSTIGNRADIERVPVESLRRFYRKYYQPDNAMLIIAGQFDPEKALEFTQKYFGEIPRPERELEQTYTEEPAQDGERIVKLRRVGDVALVGAMYHISSGAHPDYVSIDVLEHILTGAPSGLLYKALVETRRAASISGAAYALHDPGVLRFMAEVTPGNDPQDVLTTILEIVESVGEEGVTEEQVERSKRYWLKEWELAVADSSRIAIQLSEWAAQGDWRLLFLYRDRLEEVTVESVERVAKHYLRQNNRTAGMFLPTEKAQRVTVPETPELAAMIGDYKGREALAVGEAFDVSPANIEERTTRTQLSSGLDVALLPKKTRGESVHLRLTLRYGNLENLQGLNTAAELLPSLMLRGTSTMTRQQIQDELDKNRARIVPSGTPGEASFSIETRRESLPNVLELLRQILRDPSLPEDQLEIIRNQKIANLEQQLTDPTGLARTAVSRKVSDYPQDDVRYVPTIEEEIQRWKSLTRDEVQKLYSDYLGGEHGELAAVGDFDPAEVTQAFEKAVEGWKAGQPYARIPRPGDVAVNAEREVIETPDKENAIYLAGTVFPLDDTDPDYPALVIGNYILGGSGLSSRLADRVRQKEGLSYGVGSFVRGYALDERTTMLLYAITNPANIGKVEVAIREEVQRMLEEGVSAEELQAAQQGYIERQKIERSDDAQLAAVLSRTLEADRDMSYYSEREQAVRALTTEDILNVMQKWVDLDKFALVVAGDFAKAQETEEKVSEEAGK
ncbi:Protease 3 precursor [Maioricimonas rarisocia]|uniref:Protease 3 n=1 Tax=Maioricimonas rarisocia TaxID=2528026 RepID=A0A517Z8D6_9PLAN|nr:pitrilysin family protein [Maioricimonas rarisocia]QDU38723.1 Protease 3 precursor [Maioricimonas rarisocia]